MRVTIEGDPVGKGRPRFTKQGRTYTPKKTKEYETRVRRAWIEAGGPYLDGNIRIHVDAYFKMPAGWSRKKQDAMIGEPCAKKPDSDNILKSILDGLQGVAFEDDKQVTYCSVGKYWSRSGCAEIYVESERSDTSD